MKRAIWAFVAVFFLLSFLAVQSVKADKTPIPSPGSETTVQTDAILQHLGEVEGDFFSSGLLQSMDTHLFATFGCNPFHTEARQNQNGVAQVFSEATEPVNAAGIINNAIRAVGVTGGEITGDDRNEIGGCIYDGLGRPIVQGVIRPPTLNPDTPTVVQETHADGTTTTTIYGSYIQKIQGAKLTMEAKTSD